MRPPGSPKTKGSGRIAGVPNRKTQSLIEKCEAKGIDLFEALLEIAMDDKNPNQFAAIKEAIQYVAPKRKALEVSGDMDLRLIDRIKEIEALPEEEIKKLAGK